MSRGELQIEDDSILDVTQRQLVLDGRRVDLTNLEFQVISYLHERQGTVVARSELLRDVWGYEDAGGSNVIEANVRSLRRKLDWARVRLGLEDRQIARYRADVLEAIDAFSLVALDSVVLERAAEPFPTSLGSLDAIHLASAMLARDSIEGLVFRTHDDKLGTAAQATGFQDHGVSHGTWSRARAGAHRHRRSTR